MTKTSCVDVNDARFGGQYTVLDLGNVRRIALMVTPQARAELAEEVREAFSTLDALLALQPIPMRVSMQTVFVRSAEELPAIQAMLLAHYGEGMPTTSFILQPPCDGQALAIEAWAVGGEGVRIETLEAGVGVSYDRLRWLYFNGISAAHASVGAYAEADSVFHQMREHLRAHGAAFRDVTRVWLYQAGITDPDRGPAARESERYRELNRCRSDVFDRWEDANEMPRGEDGQLRYPASTGIGMADGSLTAACMALQTDRDDVQVLHLENPQQTSAFDYAREFSLRSPKFARAMAVLVGDYVTTWVSGTASILDAESVYPGDVGKQTEQTLDNIAALISRENFLHHGVRGAGAELRDLAKVRVYVKRPEDYERCRAVCERRLPGVPKIYALADVCRPELLVEIEGVAFSHRSGA